jgi:tRNA(fMet)-specific endonuclease VapC
VQSARRLHGFQSAITRDEVLPFEQAAAELAGRIIGDLERTRRPIGCADPMIAALAFERGLDMVTGNTSHFQNIQQLGYPLILVDWRS